MFTELTFHNTHRGVFNSLKWSEVPMWVVWKTRKTGKTRKRGKRGKPVIMNYYNKAMFTLYRIVKRSIAESVPDRASVHTGIAAFEAVSAPLRC